VVDCWRPTTSTPVATATTSKRNLRLAAMTVRIIAAPTLSP
jgi:hypothetical protein